MKKVLSLLLALLLLALPLASCKSGDTNSDPSEGTESSDVSGDASNVQRHETVVSIGKT